MQKGLLREIGELRGIATRLYGSAAATDHNEGIFQSIGELRVPNVNVNDVNL